jgi:hypothetical protein
MEGSYHGFGIRTTARSWPPKPTPLMTFIDALDIPCPINYLAPNDLGYLNLFPWSWIRSHFPLRHASNTTRVLLLASIPLVTRTFCRVLQPYNPLRCLNISSQSRPRSHIPFHHALNTARALLSASTPPVTRSFRRVLQPYNPLRCMNIFPRSRLQSHIPFHHTSIYTRVLLPTSTPPVTRMFWRLPPTLQTGLDLPSPAFWQS